MNAFDAMFEKCLNLIKDTPKDIVKQQLKDIGVDYYNGLKGAIFPFKVSEVISSYDIEISGPQIALEIRLLKDEDYKDSGNELTQIFIGYAA